MALCLLTNIFHAISLYPNWFIIANILAGIFISILWLKVIFKEVRSSGTYFYS